LLALAVAVGIALAAAPTLAHHSRTMFDIGKNITYRGVVEEYRWQNPHSHIVVRVGAGAADRSTVGTWTVEASAISVMTSSGWTPRTYRPGDPITVVAHPNMGWLRPSCCSSTRSRLTGHGSTARRIDMMEKKNSSPA
jgi:hypothetical protein